MERCAPRGAAPQGVCVISAACASRSTNGPVPACAAGPKAEKESLRGAQRGRLQQALPSGGGEGWGLEAPPPRSRKPHPLARESPPPFDEGVGDRSWVRGEDEGWDYDAGSPAEHDA